MSIEGKRVDVYLDTVERLEPEITAVDRDAALASIAISLKRIADRLDAIGDGNDFGTKIALAVETVAWNFYRNTR